MLDAIQQGALLQIARERIRQSCLGKPWSPPLLQTQDKALDRKRACFVTLHLEQQLRGCIGGLQATDALHIAVSRAAHNAALRDPRFSPVNINEVDALALEISVLSELQSMQWQHEADLIAQLRPGKDGLLLRDGNRSGTFLPSVWKTFHTSTAFWQQLKRKAGFSPDYWSESLTVERYTTFSFSEQGNSRSESVIAG